MKYHKVELLQPDLVVGLQRGEELAPVLGVIERFFASRWSRWASIPSVVSTSVEQRAEHREQAMARYFRGELHRFRIRPTVFMPSLPPLFELVQLDRLLVGLSDGKGRTPGSGTSSTWPRTARSG